MTPESVASFLHQYSDKIDQTQVGEYLGKERDYENGFCLKVLNEYVQLMDFKALPFDIAIRHFLRGFRLPGEAQKIDRIMETFAERYYLQNRDVFASADMAFILAFSTIMYVFRILPLDIWGPLFRHRHPRSGDKSTPTQLPFVDPF